MSGHFLKFLFLSQLFFGGSSIAFAEEYHIGVLAYRGESQAMKTWVETGGYLNKALPPHKFIITPYNISQMNKAVASNELDFVITQATHFVSLELDYGISRIATVRRDYQGNDYTRYGAIIIAKSNRNDIVDIVDLKNKKIAAVSESALGGWQMAASELDRENVEPEKIEFMGFPQSKIIFAVRDGLVDAGTIRARTFYDLADRGLISLLDFKIVAARTTQGYPFVHSTSLFPEWPIAKLSHTPKPLAAKVVSALLEMNDQDKAAISADISGWTVPLDYKPIYTLMQQLNLGPFKKIDENFVYRFQNVIILGLVLLLGFLSYKLMKRRVVLQEIGQPPLIYSSKTILGGDDAIVEQNFALFDAINDGILVLDIQGKIIHLNESLLDFIGLDKKSLIGMMPGHIILFDTDGQSVSHQEFNEKHSNAAQYTLGFLKKSDGQVHQICIEIKPLINQKDKIVGSVMVLKKSNSAEKVENEAIYHSSRDSLTGLLSRGEFESQLVRVLAEPSSPDCVLLHLDLDQFKLVNDLCGHIAGDELLREISDKLRENTKKDEKIARIGGDEFSILLHNCSIDQAAKIAERIRKSLNKIEFSWNAKSFEIGVSIGVVLITEKYASVVEVLSVADAACYAAKYSGRNRIHVFTEDDSVICQRRNEVRWAQELKNALKYDSFELVCQPILSLKEQTKNINYLEVLVRMRDGQGNLVMPMTFIPAAERYRQMSAVDKWVVKKTIGCLLQYKVHQQSTVRCFINLSSQTLSDLSFLDYVKNILLESKINPECLCFEITGTSTIANLEQATTLISELQKLGCHFALDNFGAGLSSFSCLKQLPVNYIKIDGSFIRNMSKDPVARVIVESINNICHSMKIEAIAEFVETESILSKVKSINLDYIQGNIISKPSPLPEMLEKIQHERQSEEPFI